ncbi:hypothetical protein P3L10_030612 [Capsicum annuum]
MKRYFSEISNSSFIAHSQPNREENNNKLGVSSHSSQEFDLNSLKTDPDERTSILEFLPNDRDTIRRAYLLKKSCVSQLQEFPQMEICGDIRRFNRK